VSTPEDSPREASPACARCTEPIFGSTSDTACACGLVYHARCLDGGCLTEGCWGLDAPPVVPSREDRDRAVVDKAAHISCTLLFGSLAVGIVALAVAVNGDGCLGFSLAPAALFALVAWYFWSARSRPEGDRPE